jgi:hypothetical protein
MDSDDSDTYTPLVKPHLRLVPKPPVQEVELDSQTTLREAYVFGARLLIDQPAACRVGYRLFWVQGRDLGWIDLEASPANYAVLGYHEQCDLQLPRRPQIGNRQLLASCFLMSDGTPVLRLLDLHSGHPFTIDGQPRQSICVSGPLLIGLGDCALGCVPLPEFHQQRGMLGDGQEVPPYTMSEADLPPEEPEKDRDKDSSGKLRKTHVTILPRSRRLEDAVADPRTAPPILSPAAPGYARLTLKRQQRAVSVEVGEPDLYAGVLIGRSESCLDRGLRAVLSGQISRLHLLLLAEQRRIYAIDLCSTNGTWYREKRIRRILLSDDGMRLLLSGNDSKVELTWHPRTDPREEPPK